jgi:hypothetical protein
MSRKAEKVVYTASRRDVILANFSGGSFSTAADNCTNYQESNIVGEIAIHRLAANSWSCQLSVAKLDVSALLLRGWQSVLGGVSPQVLHNRASSP